MCFIESALKLSGLHNGFLIKIKRYNRDNFGSILVITAVLLPILLAASALVLEFMRASNIKARLDSAADSAVMIPLLAEMRKKTKREQKQAAIAMFNLNIASIKDKIDDPILTIELMSKSSNPRDPADKVRVTYKAKVHPLFGKIMPVDAFKLSGLSEASTNLTSDYIDFFMLLDSSNSMGLGATMATMNSMKNSIGCQLACHDSSGKIQSRGFETRFDVVGKSVANIIDIARKTDSKTVRFAIYQFGNNIWETHALSTDLNTAHGKASDLRLRDASTHTDFKKALDGLNDFIRGPSGDGSSPEQSRKYVFFITDGMEDKSPGHQTGPVNPFWCDIFKKRGIKVVVIYTTYYNIPGYERFYPGVLPRISPSLRACASSADHFVEAGEANEIHTKVSELFARSLKSSPYLSK